MYLSSSSTIGGLSKPSHAALFASRLLLIALVVVAIFALEEFFVRSASDSGITVIARSFLWLIGFGFTGYVASGVAALLNPRQAVYFLAGVMLLPILLLALLWKGGSSSLLFDLFLLGVTWAGCVHGFGLGLLERELTPLFREIRNIGAAGGTLEFHRKSNRAFPSGSMESALN